MIRAAAEHLELISAYLHNTRLDPRTLSLDRPRWVLSLRGERICHERAESDRMFFLPILRSPSISTEIRITNVIDLSWKPKDKVWGVDDERQLLVRIKLRPDGLLSLELERSYLLLRLSPPLTIEIADQGEPDAKGGSFSFFRHLPVWLNEIDQLRQ